MPHDETHPGVVTPADELGPPRCLGCAYVLIGLPGLTCPECGRLFDPNDAATFTRKPPFVMWRFWLPGTLLAFATGVVSFAAVLPAGVGFAATIATPLCVGAIIGYASRLRILLIMVASACVIIGIVVTIAELNLAGMFCAIVAAVIITPVAVAGALCGVLLRWRLKSSRFSQREYLPIVLLMLAPSALAWIEAQFLIAHATISVQTVRVVNLSAADAWDRVRFYEELDAPRPWILRIGAPRPVGVVHPDPTDPDDVLCLYERGHVRKRITRVVPMRAYEFDVVEQNIGEERSVRLISGGFEFEPIDSSHTRITLTSRYIPKLGPRICWWPAEYLIVRGMHGYILDGIESARPDRGAHFASGAKQPWN